MSEEFSCADLGWCIARARKDTEKYTAQLTIVSPADASESGTFTPAQSISLWRSGDVRALRDLLNWALGEKP